MTALEYCRDQLGDAFKSIPMRDKQQLLNYAREEMAEMGIEITAPVSAQSA